MNTVIIENEKQYALFLEKWNDYDSIIIPIWSDSELHYKLNSLSLLYIRILETNYILPLNHIDCTPIKLNDDLTHSTKHKFIWNLKGFLHSDIQIKNAIDIQTPFYFNTNELLNLDSDLIELCRNYFRYESDNTKLCYLPMMLIIKLLDNFNPVVKLQPEYNWINNDMIPLLNSIESVGLRVDIDKFKDRWPNNMKQLNEDIIHTEYNPYIITTRPSNRHGGINFGALNKNDGTREVFIPRDGYIFLQFDYDAYHIRIIANLIKYNLPKTSAHQWLLEQYTLQTAGITYEDAKARTFRILYGGVTDDDKFIDFFNKVDIFIHKLYGEFKKNGYIRTPMGRIIKSNFINNPTPQKVFNYMLQSIETELNIKILKKLKDLDLPTPILYLYDSFLFEYPITDNMVMAKNIKHTLENSGFPVKVSWGMDYSKL